MSSSRLSRSQSGMKNFTEVTLNLSSNVNGNSNDEANFRHKLLLTNTQVSRLCKTVQIIHHLIKLSKTKLHKIRQSGWFLRRLLGPLLKTGLPRMKNVLKPLSKSVLIPLGLTASAIDAAIQTKVFWPGMTTLIISNEEIDDVMNIIRSLGESELLIKGISGTTKNEAKEQRGRFLVCY